MLAMAPRANGSIEAALHLSSPGCNASDTAAEGWFPRDDSGPAPDVAAEDVLAVLAAAVGPLRWALASIAERFIDTQAHHALCFARLSDYARECPGLSARQLQELARVKRACSELPPLEAALLSNELPWSKGRAIARVATLGDVRDWIAQARHLTCRDLDQQVRAFLEETKKSESHSERQQSVRLSCTPAVRTKWHIARELAERVSGERLSDADALECVLGEAVALYAPEVSDERECSWSKKREPRPGSHPEPAPRRPGFELPSAVRRLVEGLRTANPFELDRRLRAAVRLEQTLDAAMAPWLRHVSSSHYEWKHEFQTLAGFAREQLGISSSKARALVRIERVGEICPELSAAYREGRLSWTRAQALLPLLSIQMEGAWRPRWVQWATEVTVERLSSDVTRALLLRAGTHDAWQRCKFDPARTQDPVSERERQMCAHEVDTEASETLHWCLPASAAAIFRGLLREIGFEALLDRACEEWTRRDPAARRPNPVIERDGYRCTAPACTSRRNLHDHHIRFRSRGGGDETENRVTLCAFHHLRGVHEGRMRLTGRAPGELRFQMPFGSFLSCGVRVPIAAEPHAHPVGTFLATTGVS